MKIVNKKTLFLLKKQKNNKKKIGLCHGTFDLLHAGHIRHFNTAKKNCDILVVSITADKFVNKGLNRPYLNQLERYEILSSVKFIDYIYICNSFTADQAIKEIQPNLYFKGPDYKNNNLDITGNIKKEINLIKKIGGKVFYTSDQTMSSSKILNILESNSSKQNQYIRTLKSKINFIKIKDAFNSISKKKVLIIGENIIDQYNFCETLGKSGKEPHLVLKHLKSETYPGGVVAIAKHLSNFCKSVKILTSIGSSYKKEINFIKKNTNLNVSLEYVYRKNVLTIKKKRFIDNLSKHKLIGIYEINDNLLEKELEHKMIKKIKKNISKYDLVIVADYGHGLITKKMAKLICLKSKNLNLNAQLNASNIGFHTLRKYFNFRNIQINESELRHEYKDRNSSVKILSKKLAKEQVVKQVLVTRGAEGCILYNKQKNKFFECPAFANKIVDKVGAGDAVFSLFSLFNSIKMDTDLKIFISSYASVIVVESMANSNTIDKNNLLRSLEHLFK